MAGEYFASHHNSLTAVTDTIKFNFHKTFRSIGHSVHTSKLRRVGGSFMLAVPPALLEQLQIKTGATVALGLDKGRLVVEPLPRPRYTLAELLAKSNYAEAQTQEDREWGNSTPVGKELL